jgi:hypothetical protein
MNAQQFAQIVSEYPCLAQAALEVIERAARLRFPSDPVAHGELLGSAASLRIWMNTLANERDAQQVAA